MRNVFRIFIWASAGFLVAAGWGFYFSTANKGIPIGPVVSALARLTEPVAGVVVYFKPDYPFGLRSVAIANVVTYAFAGLIVETTRRRVRRPNA